MKWQIERIAMACFIEGIEPAEIGLPSVQLAQCEAIIATIVSGSELDTYYRCLDLLSQKQEE